MRKLKTISFSTFFLLTISIGIVSDLNLTNHDSIRYDYITKPIGQCFARGVARSITGAASASESDRWFCLD